MRPHLQENAFLLRSLATLLVYFFNSINQLAFVPLYSSCFLYLPVTLLRLREDEASRLPGDRPGALL